MTKIKYVVERIWGSKTERAVVEGATLRGSEYREGKFTLRLNGTDPHTVRIWLD